VAAAERPGVSDDSDEPTNAPDGADAPPESTSDESVPAVELSLYQLSVSVSGQAEDDLRDVEESAIRLVDYLVDRAETLEESPDKRGLG
jgi:hypothetical protein